MRAALILATLSLLLSACLSRPPSNPGSLVVTNTNFAALGTAARAAFAEAGYRPGPARLPRTLTFDRPAGALGELAFGSHGRTTTFRVTLDLVPLAGSHDFRLVPSVARISSASRPGFDRERDMSRFWSSQIRPILRTIRDQAENAGPGRRP